MGGFVYVNTGLLKLADNEAELASVIAHEIGHIASRHAVEQMRKQQSLVVLASGWLRPQHRGSDWCGTGAATSPQSAG